MKRKRPSGTRPPVYMDTVAAFDACADWGDTPPELRQWILEFMERSLPKLRNCYNDLASLHEWMAQILTLTPENLHPYLLQTLMVAAWLVDAEHVPGRVAVAKVKRMELRAVSGEAAQRIIRANQTIRKHASGGIWQPVEGTA